MKSDKKLPEYYFDIRVRERLLSSGMLDPKVLEQHLAELADLEPNTDTVGIEQPALNSRDGE